MKSPEAMFPAKLLLFGEYSILLGSSALSLPFPHFNAYLKYVSDETATSIVRAPNSISESTLGTVFIDASRGEAESNRQLRHFYDYLAGDQTVSGTFLDLNHFLADLNQGIYLESDIPQRYGMGSSGALCASVYHRYSLETNHPVKSPGQARLDDPIPPGSNLKSDAGVDAQSPLQQPDQEIISALRNRFRMMESFFHGKSSGFDPLVSYLKTPLHQGKEGTVSSVTIKSSSPMPKVMLVDSGLHGETGPLVHDFLQKFIPGGLISSKGKELTRLTDAAIVAFLSNNFDESWNSIVQLSLFQFKEMIHLVPQHLRAIWSEGIQTGIFSLKLCGSGGGGYLLCFTRNPDTAAAYFDRKKIQSIMVFS